MAGTLLINAESLIGLARQPAYNWMRSIETVRLLARQASPGCRACQTAKPSNLQLSRNSYLKIAGSAGFRAELATIKAQQGLSSIQIAMDGTFDTI